MKCVLTVVLVDFLTSKSVQTNQLRISLVTSRYFIGLAHELYRKLEKNRRYTEKEVLHVIYKKFKRSTNLTEAARPNSVLASFEISLLE